MFRLSFVLILSNLGINTAHGQGPGFDLSELVHDLAAAETPREFVDYAYAVTQHASIRDFTRLKSHENDNVAIFAAWKLIARTAAMEAPLDALPDDLDDGNRLPVAECFRFFGFLEGRLGVSPPRMWQRCLLSGRIFEDERMYFDARFYRAHAAGDLPNLETVDCITGFESTKGKGMAVTTPDGQRIVMAQSEFEKAAGKRVARLRVVSDKERVYLCAFTGGPAALLTAFDLQTRKALWSQECNPHRDGLFGGDSSHWVTMRIKGSSLFVFGALEPILYVSQFDCVSGQRQFHFSTDW